MTGVHIDPSRAPVAFGRLAIPELFAQLVEPDAARRLRALASLCDLTHDPERLYQVVTEGFLDQLDVLLKDGDSAVRTRTCELLHLITSHNIARQALLSSPLLARLSQLLDDPSPLCRTRAHRVINSLALLPAGRQVHLDDIRESQQTCFFYPEAHMPGANALQNLVPKMMLKLQEEQEEKEEEVQALLLSTLSCCSRLDAGPALSHRGVTLIGRKLSHTCSNIRREAAGAMMALSVPVEGKRQVCEAAVLPVLADLLRDQDVDVQANAAGAIMNTVVITTGKHQCLELDVLPVLLQLLSERKQDVEEEQRRKALVLYSLRALTSLAEAPDGRQRLLLELPLLVGRSEPPEEDADIRCAARTAVNVVTWTP
ncbi:radial spoke head 14 homolog isoform X1 [Phyllopteryx taeniolatus]|uniref:radial spoke head 14 homolog isoform X1 n=1 Tax=Phyllopteryx taeniolatus TaxID=161469 RepID=UPI002AD472D5|nr:radial spoke head 14 homolog isoform X1 [Phyllopteryx taeniolatus]